ncbi:uncharacterized protein LOC114519849 [Dendronephthya gigantea]|uniref:uncharacterized protein LOC114519849 n=1 Tax=Dendronephthya gigantea TaxID=151771 RepID=UPI00106CC602|nr:uncharacterized protein LOC114519849 [Dendronephthya gigantea]
MASSSILQLLCPCITNEDDYDQPEVISRYDGERNVFGQKHGYGEYHFNNGDLYQGCWKSDKMHGSGVYTYSSGKKAEGFFQEGKFIGKQPQVYDPDDVSPLPDPENIPREEQIRRQRTSEENERKRIEREERRKRTKERQEKWRNKYGTIQAK